MAEELAEFEIQENDVEETNAEKRNSRVRCWVGTWNNPSMSDEEFTAHLKNLLDEDYLKYAIFQRERGEQNGTIHFQFFIDFKNSRHFKWVKDKLPYGCHFKPMRSTKTRCRDYCSKTDTRVSGYYEIGEFIEERQRTDLMKIISMLKEGISFDKVQEIYPSQCIMYKRQLSEYAQNYINKKCKGSFRDIKVTFIYGKPSTGKSTYAYNTLGFEDTFSVDMYDNSMFTHYNNEKNLLFDEFTGKIEITYMNKLLDRYPVQLRGLNTVKYAAYDNVFIISNLPLSKLYKNIQETEPDIYKAFLRRIGRIIRFDDYKQMHIEKDVYETSHQEEMKEIAEINELPFKEDELY